MAVLWLIKHNVKDGVGSKAVVIGIGNIGHTKLLTTVAMVTTR